MATRAHRVIRPRELVLADVTVGAGDMEADLLLELLRVEVRAVGELRRLGLPDVVARVLLERGREWLAGTWGRDLGMADLAELAGRDQKRLRVALVAGLVVVAAGPGAHRVALVAADLRVLLVREPGRIAVRKRDLGDALAGAGREDHGDR